MADTKRYIDLPDLALYKELEEAKVATDLNAGLAKKTDKEVISGGNKALIFNESDGGGAKFEHADGTWSYVGVNDGGKDGITGQLYSVMRENGVSTGTRLNMTNGGFYYTTGKSNAAYSADDELATKGDVKKADAKDKTVYLKDESSGQSVYGAVYVLYQGADESDMSQNTKVGTINIPKSTCVKSGSVETVVTPDVPYPGAKVGDKYIDLVLADENNTHIYIPVSDLVDAYTVEKNATQVQLAISDTNEISATLVDGGVAHAKLADNAVEANNIKDGEVSKAKLDSSLAAEIANKTDRQVTGSNGKALMFNENDGGGAKFENNDGTWSFVGVNDGGAGGLDAQVYAVNKDTKAGARINVSTTGAYYTNGNTSYTYTADDEIATKGYVDDIAGDSTESVDLDDIRALFSV